MGASELAWRQDEAPADTGALAPIGAALPALLAALRVAIALASLALIGNVAGAELGLSVLYVLFGLGTYWLAMQQSPWAGRQFMFWLDAAWLLSAAAVAAHQMPYFALLLLFPTSVIAFSLGVIWAGAMAAICAVVLVSIALAEEAGPGVLQLPLLLLLGVMIYLIAELSSLGHRLRRHGALLPALGDVMSPRLSRDGLVSQAMNALARSFPDSAGLMVMPGAQGATLLAELDQGRTSIFPAGTTDAAKLPEIPGTLVVSLDRQQPAFLPGLRYYALDIATGRRSRAGEAQANAVADLLDARWVISVPLLRRGRPWGRLHLGSRSSRLSLEDALWLRHFASRLEAALANADLLQQMIEDAAAQERNQISRNLHDSAIQPYLGLKFGIEALARQVPPGDSLRPDVDRLAALANQEVLALRKLVRTLDGQAGFVDDTLERAIRRHAARFARLFNMEIHVDFDCDESLDDELATHVFHIVSEGLSNVSRHTRAQSATIRMACRDGELELQIRNSVEGVAPAAFTPRSIFERARDLGGRAEVSLGQAETVVRIRLAARQGGDVHDD